MQTGIPDWRLTCPCSRSMNYASTRQCQFCRILICEGCLDPHENFHRQMNGPQSPTDVRDQPPTPLSPRPTAEMEEEEVPPALPPRRASARPTSPGPTSHLPRKPVPQHSYPQSNSTSPPVRGPQQAYPQPSPGYPPPPTAYPFSNQPAPAQAPATSSTSTIKRLIKSKNARRAMKGAAFFTGLVLGVDAMDTLDSGGGGDVGDMGGGDLGGGDLGGGDVGGGGGGDLGASEMSQMMNAQAGWQPLQAAASMPIG